MCPTECSHGQHISPLGVNGIELIKIMKAEMPKLPILVLSMYDEERYALRALRAGGLGISDQVRSFRMNSRALRKILEEFMSVRSSVNKCCAGPFRQAEESRDSLERRLSPRQLEVLELVWTGTGNEGNSIQAGDRTENHRNPSKTYWKEVRA